LVSEIRKTKGELHRHKNKVYGSAPECLRNREVKYSFNLVADDHAPSLSDELPLLNHLIIDHRGMPYAIWEGLYVVCCLFSSYLYGYLASF